MEQIKLDEIFLLNAIVNILNYGINSNNFENNKKNYYSNLRSKQLTETLVNKMDELIEINRKILKVLEDQKNG